MPIFKVSKSIVIKAPVDAVFASVRDFKEWVAWSPWVIAEPECRLEYAEDGKSYTWDGEIIGAGELAVTEETALKSIDYRLSFLRPWKSVNKTWFVFSEGPEGTEVTWNMEGSLPFFMFFLKGMMTAFVGMDYERGLRMLKDLLETGSVPSKLNFKGVESCEARTLLGVRKECAIAEIGAVMESAMGEVHSAFGEAGLKAAGPPLSVYHKWKMVAGRTEFTAGLPVASAPASLPGALVVVQVPASKVYVVEHTGPYRHLGNAWSAGMMHAQGKVFRKDRKHHPFEVYLNDPREVPANELVTAVHLGAK